MNGLLWNNARQLICIIITILWLIDAYYSLLLLIVATFVMGTSSTVSSAGPSESGAQIGELKMGAQASEREESGPQIHHRTRTSKRERESST